MHIPFCIILKQLCLHQSVEKCFIITIHFKYHYLGKNEAVCLVLSLFPLVLKQKSRRTVGDGKREVGDMFSAILGLN